MLEKIGLPPKPSLRGNNWVIDASHCQSCSSNFTFINRKHHCRRCGGIFCNSCTQLRMMLRGQGDAPVRICEPCKKLEEAARFELRTGSRSRAAKGSSKFASRNADDILNELLGNNSKDSLSMGSGKEVANEDVDQVMPESTSDGVNSEIGVCSPEELRQQSLDERNKYKTLKAEGKSAEALKAFKRAKELERQAAALDLQLRKNRKKALASSSSVTETQRNEEPSLENDGRVKPTHQKVKKKDDLTDELRELGWSDVDINDAEKKPGPTSLEGELLNLIGHELRGGGESKVSSSVDKSQVIQMKKKALAFKREGKLAEAKEELKRAKILEKQLEEQELLGDAEESDDELSALIRGLDDDDKQKDFSAGFNLMDSKIDLDLDFNNLDGNFEVTDDDMHDPDMAAALSSLGWDEEPSQPVNIAAEILNLKREAVSEKRAGNMAEAMSLLKKAKALEKDLESTNETAVDPQVTKIDKKPVGKSRIMIQKELLALKKKALGLRREGKLEEADEELKKGKVLELQLEEIDNAPKIDSETSELDTQKFDLSSDVARGDEDADVTDQDLNDPSYLSVLKNLGWQEEENKPAMPLMEEVAHTVSSSAAYTVRKPRRSKGEIQRELLGLKRKALGLRRQGQETEAEEILLEAKVLEEQLAEMDAPKSEVMPDLPEHKPQVETRTENLPEIGLPIMDKGTSQTPLKRPAESSHDSDKRQVLDATTHEEAIPSESTVSPDNQKSPSQQEILAHKRRALAFKREGKLSEAREELRKAKLLERSIEENKPTNSASSPPPAFEHDNSPPISKPQEERAPSISPPKPMSSNERFKLQRECLNHKRNALKLRREGKTEEADAELEIAKNLEAQLEEATPHDSTTTPASTSDDAGVEDFLDPQLLSALKAIGLQDVPQATEKAAENESDNNSIQERARLEAEIKAEKVKALNLKRAGKQAEALDTLRRAKQMEKKLNSPTV